MDWSSLWNRSPRRRKRAALAAEPLEGRALLSTFVSVPPHERPGRLRQAERFALRHYGRQAAPVGTTAAPATTADPSGGTAPAATPSTATPAASTSGSTTPTTATPGNAAPATPAGSPMGRGFGMVRGFAMRRGFAMGGFDGGMAPMQGGGGSSSGATTPTDPRVTALQQYQADVKTIYDKSQVTPALQSALTADLQAISKAATTAPDSTKVLTLRSDLSTLAGTLPTAAQLATLQTDFAAAVTSEGVTDASKVTKTFADLDAVIAATNLTADDVTTLSNDLKAAGLSTVAPLVAPLGVNLQILDLAINMHAGATTNAPMAPATS